jgi:acyl carrier protein
MALAGVRDEKEIRARLREYILTTLLEGEEPINLTDLTPLVSGGIIDSLNAQQVGAFIDQLCSVKLTPEELVRPENMETIDAIAKLVLSKLSQSGGSSSKQSA